MFFSACVGDSAETFWILIYLKGEDDACFTSGRIGEKSNAETEQLKIILTVLLLLAPSQVTVFSVSPHSIGAVLKMGEIILGPNPGNHF